MALIVNVQTLISPVVSATTPVIPSVAPKKATPQHKMRSEFVETEIFQVSKAQVIKEIEETLELVGMTRGDLARKLNLQPSGITQSLDPKKGMQFSTLIRIADALDCDVEVNFIRR